MIMSTGHDRRAGITAHMGEELRTLGSGKYALRAGPGLLLLAPTTRWVYMGHEGKARRTRRALVTSRLTKGERPFACAGGITRMNHAEDGSRIEISRMGGS